MENPTWLIFFLIVAAAGILRYSKSSERKTEVNPPQPQTPQPQQVPSQQVPKTLWEKIKADVMVIAIAVIALATLETIAWARIPILWNLFYDSW